MADDTTTNGGEVRFRVSDAVAVPKRGMLLRLKRIQGRPDIKRLQPGNGLKLIAPDGATRMTRIIDHSETGGRQTQERLERYGELDVVVPTADALADDNPVEIGWQATTA